MIELQAATDSYPIWKAILWCFYPVSALVAIEFFLRSVNDDDDDFQGGKGVRAAQPAYAPTGA